MLTHSKLNSLNYESQTDQRSMFPLICSHRSTIKSIFKGPFHLPDASRTLSFLIYYHPTIHQLI